MISIKLADALIEEVKSVMRLRIHKHSPNNIWCSVETLYLQDMLIITDLQHIYLDTDKWGSDAYENTRLDEEMFPHILTVCYRAYQFNPYKTIYAVRKGLNIPECDIADSLSQVVNNYIELDADFEDYIRIYADFEGELASVTKMESFTKEQWEVFLFVNGIFCEWNTDSRYKLFKYNNEHIHITFDKCGNEAIIEVSE